MVMVVKLLNILNYLVVEELLVEQQEQVIIHQEAVVYIVLFMETLKAIQELFKLEHRLIMEYLVKV